MYLIEFQIDCGERRNLAQRRVAKVKLQHREQAEVGPAASVH